MNALLIRIVCSAVVAASCLERTTNASIIDTKDSANFSYKYEMDVLPDSNGDWRVDGANGGTVADGLLLLSSSTDRGAYTSDTIGEIWPGKTTYNTGYTIEARVKITSATIYGYGLQGIPGPTTASQPCSELWINENQLVWGDGSSQVILASGQDNTNDFHVFRLAQESGVGAPGAATYSVWRDGVLLSNSLSEPFMNQGLERIIFGGFAGGHSAVSETDYVRFEVGAYAPVPEPASIAILISASSTLLVCSRRRKQ